MIPKFVASRIFVRPPPASGCSAESGTPHSPTPPPHGATPHRRRRRNPHRPLSSHPPSPAKRGSHEVGAGRGLPFNTGGGGAHNQADAEQPERPAPPAAIAARVDRAIATAGHRPRTEPRPAFRSPQLPPAPVGMPALRRRSPFRSRHRRRSRSRSRPRHPSCRSEPALPGTPARGPGRPTPRRARRAAATVVPARASDVPRGPGRSGGATRRPAASRRAIALPPAPTLPVVPPRPALPVVPPRPALPVVVAPPFPSRHPRRPRPPAPVAVPIRSRPDRAPRRWCCRCTSARRPRRPARRSHDRLGRVGRHDGHLDLAVRIGE